MPDPRYVETEGSFFRGLLAGALLSFPFWSLVLGVFLWLR